MTVSVLNKVQHYDSAQGAVTGPLLCEGGVSLPRDFTERNFAFREEIQSHSCGSYIRHSSSLTPSAELSIVKGHVAKGRAGFRSPNLSEALAAPCSCGRGFSYGWAQRESARTAGFLWYRSTNPLSPNHPVRRGWSGQSLSRGVRP